MNPEKITKMDEEVKKWSRKDPMAIKKAMVYPHTLEALERGAMVKDYNANSTNLDSEDEEDPRTPASVSSQVSSRQENQLIDLITRMIVSSPFSHLTNRVSGKPRLRLDRERLCRY